MVEVLYPMDLIKRTFRAISEEVEPTTTDQVIEFTDVRQTLVRLPAQYRHALNAWYVCDGEPTEIAMMMKRDLEDARTTLRSAWRYLYDLLNGEPSG